ncbi:MAG: type I-E CRISPR-associated protein Cse2/CasB [Candidatus Fermentibacteraceae bacterium]|nr:type I-E CRISPR-associated protein Cse2/CasB [Candidatus Fermentibacteraceae bacterium]MBN2609315.1 type I-E CRISPR-associated protein Cse2/CasB [Candidatus Fermentibacteraceae bacterium]
MSENENTTMQGSEPTEEKRRSLASITGQITHSIDSVLSPGDVAELRRLTPSDPFSPAFFKLVTSFLESDPGFPSHGKARDEIERRWAVFIQAAAQMKNLHSMKVGLGYALASSGYSELRLVRLLRASDPILYREVRTAAHYLAAKAQTCNLVDMAYLLLIQVGEKAESVRRSIARDYYGYKTRSEKEN